MNNTLPHTVRGQAFAKINLGLHVLRRRHDGFHDIETVMVAIEWHDTLEVRSAQDLSFTCSDHELEIEDNLCLRAAQLLAKECESQPGARIHLEKHLPHGAGLGGGSSDAAKTLLMLNDLWELKVDEGRLQELAAELGSDVPFFLTSEPALATGRGEILTTLSSGEQPYVFPFEIVVSLPHVRVSTAEAYQMVQPSDKARPNIPEIILSNDLARWRADLVNDFEMPIIGRHPAIGVLRETMYDAGAGYAAMSGSGSAVFGIFDEHASATAAAELLREQGFSVWHGRSAEPS
jgi:4-diphosphocytidyl-2-C-methyl-D-erythritol kinase